MTMWVWHKDDLKVYTVSDHDSHIPWGAGSVVVARNRDQAREILDKELVRQSLAPYDDRPYTLIEMPLDLPFARVMLEGQLHKTPGVSVARLPQEQLHE